MTKARSNYLYKLTGFILSRTLVKASPQSQYARKKYLNLKVVLENQPKSLQVFKEKANPTLWRFLKQTKPKELTGQRFLFHCQNVRGFYHLLDWEKLPAIQPATSEEIPTEIPPQIEGGQE